MAEHRFYIRTMTAADLEITLDWAAAEGWNPGLDGVIAQIDNYRKFGFQISHRHIRHQGTGQAGDRDPAAFALTELPWEQLERYDRAHCGYPRAAFLEPWIRLNFGYALVEDGDLRGYGVIRACREGFKIGPLFAEHPQIADRLFQSLMTTAADQPIFLDIPDCNSEAQALVRRHGMRPVFECARMYSGDPPQVNLQQIYGVTCLELG